MTYNKMLDYDRIDDNIREYRGFVFKRTDPHGFWIVTDKSNKAVPGFSVYTDPYLLRIAVDEYLYKKKK